MILGMGPRYLRFVRALLLGSTLAVVPLTAACGDDDDDDCADCGDDDDDGMDDAGMPDSGPIDGPVAVDGPLPPPDLPAARA